MVRAAGAAPMTPSAIANHKKRIRQLKQRDADRQAKRQATLEAWFREFDVNQDGRLQRDELARLLTHLQPESPPQPTDLDFLIERATRVETHSMLMPGNRNGAIGWNDALETVLRYGDHVREKATLDGIFAEYDAVRPVVACLLPVCAFITC